MCEIAVVVPIYKVELYLERCIESILAQTFTEFKLILVDDGSPDQCGQICDRYVKRDSRVNVIHQENQGISVARNTGIDWIFENTNCEWITFVDGDDWIHPKTLEKLFEAVLENDVMISACGYQKTSGEEIKIDEKQLDAKLWKPEDFYLQHSVNATVPWGKLYHKSCFRTIRYPVQRIHEDEFVTYKILFENNLIAVIEASLYAYFNNLEGITKAPWIPERLDVLEALQEQIAYFQEKKMFIIKRRRELNYIIALCNNVCMIRENNNMSRREVRRYERELVREARKMIIKYRINEGLTIDDNIWIYEIVFPNMMKIYWIIKALMSKCIFKSKM